jgi:ABC-2 type transport system ATP-binding protein
MSGLPVAEFQDVGMSYPTGFLGRGQRAALEHISFLINSGEIFALIGPNRAGKTTLVKILLSLCHPTAGQGLRFQRPLPERQTLARIGYVHENPAFPRYLSARALMEFYGALTLLRESVVRSRTAALLEKVGLADRSHEPISSFSKGMVQRLAIAQALLNDPELLVLDEPSEGLDLMGRRLVRDVIIERRQRGFTVLLVSHVIGDIEQLCDRVGVLVEGQLVYSGTVADLVRDPKTGKSGPIEPVLHRLYTTAHFPSAADKNLGERSRPSA